MNISYPGIYITDTTATRFQPSHVSLQSKMFFSVSLPRLPIHIYGWKYQKLILKIKLSWKWMWLWQTELLPFRNKQASSGSLKSQTAWSLHTDYPSWSRAMFGGLLVDTNLYAAGDFSKSNQAFPSFRSSKVKLKKSWTVQTVAVRTFSIRLFPLPNPFTCTWVITSISDSDTVKWSDLLISLKGLQQAVFHINHIELLSHHDFFCLKGKTTKPLTKRTCCTAHMWPVLWLRHHRLQIFVCSQFHDIISVNYTSTSMSPHIMFTACLGSCL